MEVIQLQRRYIEDNASLFNEGYFDGQFAQLQQLQASDSPGFVFEVVSMYFTDSDKILKDITESLDQQPIDFKKLDAYAHRFKGSSSGVGAQRVRDAIIEFRRFCDEHNTEACMSCLLRVKQEYSIVKDKLNNLLTLEQQIVHAGGAVPLLRW